MAIRGVKESKAFKKFDMKIRRSVIEAVVLEHIKAASMALESEREGIGKKQRRRRKRRSKGEEGIVEVGF